MAQDELNQLLQDFDDSLASADENPWTGDRLDARSVEAHGSFVTFSKSDLTEILNFQSRNDKTDIEESMEIIKNLPNPRLTYFCNEDARPGYQSKLAHEYEEEPFALAFKIKVLCGLIMKSENCVAYTGAGISTASGIGDYASKGKKERKLKNYFLARPTLSHRVLTEIQKIGKLKHWVQQNHDGLPQKAGFPQESLNEIHGAWFDPSNPVVPMTGHLRSDLFKDLQEWSARADLCLTLGSSLCGMSADSLVTKTSGRSMWRNNDPENKAVKTINKNQLKKKYPKDLGAVIVSLQQTQYDDICSLRIFAKLDLVFALVCRELGLTNGVNNFYYDGNALLKDPIVASNKEAEDVFFVPYDKEGRRIGDESLSQKSKIKWSLQTGKKIRLTQGPGEGFEGEIVSKTEDKHYVIRLPFQRNDGNKEKAQPDKKQLTNYVLGAWWVECAVKGKVEQLPFVNI